MSGVASFYGLCGVALFVLYGIGEFGGEGGNEVGAVETTELTETVEAVQGCNSGLGSRKHDCASCLCDSVSGCLGFK